MSSIKVLEEKVKALEDRLSKVENKITQSYKSDDQDLMEALYKKAKDLVIKNNKASAIFLQKKLWVDFVRASKLIDELEAHGVIKRESASEPWKIIPVKMKI
jgi:S-DNA-T family DNA segregation ATPase FtsK/SpoIIIE